MELTLNVRLFKLTFRSQEVRFDLFVYYKNMDKLSWYRRMLNDVKLIS